MQLIKLVTENFKKLGSREFTFTEGVNIISGDNGQGKSTVLRAVAVALFGPTMLPGVSGDIPTRGTNTWDLTLTFEHAGIVYEVQRGKSKAFVKVEDEIVASGQLPVTAYIEDLLNISAKDYNLLVHSRQGETNYVITYGATALQRKVEEFAGIAEIDKIIVEAGSRAKDAKQRAEWLDEQLPSSGESDEMEKLYESKANELNILSAELKILMAVEPPVEPSKPPFNLSEERAKLRKYMAWEAEEAAYHREYAELQAQLQDLPTPVEVPDSSELSERQRTLKKDISEAKRVEAERSALTTTLMQLQFQHTNLKTIELENPSTEDLGHAAEVVEDVTEQLARLNRLRERQEYELEQLHSRIDKGVCISCGTTLTGDLETLEAQAVVLSSETTELIDSIVKVKQELTDATTAQRELTDKRTDYTQHQQKLADLHLQIDAIQLPTAPADVEMLEAELLEVTVNLQRYEALQEEADTLKRRRNRLTQNLGKLQRPESVEEVTLASIEEKELQQNVYEIDHANWKHAAQAIQHDVEVKTSEVNVLDAEFSTLQKQRVEIRRKTQEQLTLKNEGDIADRLAKYLRNRRAAYLKEVWDSIMMVSSRFLTETTWGWMTETGIEDGKFMFREDGVWVPAVETSGAQSAFLGTALRIGLNKALYRGNTFLAFDEPTEAMTEENARNLVAALAGESKQVFLITHKQSDQNLANNLIEV